MPSGAQPMTRLKDRATPVALIVMRRMQVAVDLKLVQWFDKIKFPLGRPHGLIACNSRDFIRIMEALNCRACAHKLVARGYRRCLEGPVQCPPSGSGMGVRSWQSTAPT
jgi:hypothetical protein